MSPSGGDLLSAGRVTFDAFHDVIGNPVDQRLQQPACLPQPSAIVERLISTPSRA